MSKPLWVASLGILATALLTNQAVARAPYNTEFKGKYYKPDGSETEKELAKKIDMAKCTVCHGKNAEGKEDKKIRNDYGKAVEKLLGMKNVKAKPAIQMALDAAYDTKVPDGSETYGDRIKTGKLPAGVAAPALPTADADSPEPIPDIGPTGPIVKLHTGFEFTEGPAADAQGNVYFSDIPASRTYKVDLNGKLSIFREPSNSTNGMMFNAAGELVGCEMGSQEMAGQVTAVSPDGKTVRVLAATYQGKRFNSPNDLVIDADGGVYFTDPYFGPPQPLPQGVTAVYYISAEGEVTRLIDDLKAPNGVILSPDEKTLYVVPSRQEEVMAYAVAGPGKLGKGRSFRKLTQPEGKSGSGGDGLTVDTKGNLYITSALGLQVFDADGKLLGIIAVPEQPANVTFGGADMKTLYITARTSLYTAPMEAQGHRFPAGKKE